MSKVYQAYFGQGLTGFLVAMHPEKSRPRTVVQIVNNRNRSDAV